MLQLALDVIAGFTSGEDDEKMTSTLFQFVAVVAGVAILATGLIVFPRAGMRGLAKGLAVTVSLAVIAAFLITAARSFGP